MMNLQNMPNKVLKEYGTMKITVISPNFLVWKFIFYISFKFKGFNIFIKQCYLISQSVKKIQKKNPKGLQKQTRESQCFHQTVRIAIVKKSRFIKEEESSGLLRSLGITASLDKVPLSGLF